MTYSVDQLGQILSTHLDRIVDALRKERVDITPALNRIADALHKERVDITPALDRITNALVDSSTQQRRFIMGMAFGVLGMAVTVTAAATKVVCAMRQPPAGDDDDDARR